MQTVLADDPRNYHALVLSGVAFARLEKFDKAEKAYDDATAITPGAALAWQGLADVYEKNGDRFLDLNRKLCAVYRKLLALPDCDQKKRLEISLKLAEVMARQELHAEAVQVLLALPGLGAEEASTVQEHVLRIMLLYEDCNINKYKLRNLGCSSFQVCSHSYSPGVYVFVVLDCVRASQQAHLGMMKDAAGAVGPLHTACMHYIASGRVDDPKVRGGVTGLTAGGRAVRPGAAL